MTDEPTDDTDEPIESTDQSDSMPTGGRFCLLDEAALSALPRPAFLVEDILVQHTLAELHGPPGAGKSFVALDLGLSIAIGQPWQGQAVHPGLVVYIAAEGGLGLRQRVRAWTDHHGCTGQVGGFRVLAQPVNLLTHGDVHDLLAALAGLPERPALVIVDTLARCMLGGEENSSRDVGEVIAACDRVRTAVGCTVLLVHHTRKDGAVERGSTALRGAADTMLALAKDGETIVISCDKQKDAEPFPDITLMLTPASESCVLVPTAAAPKDPSRPTGSAFKVLSILVDLFLADGATFTEWLGAFAGGPGDPKKLHTSFLRARKELVTDGYVAKDGTKRGARYVATDRGINAVRSTRVHEGPTDPTDPTEVRVQSGPHPFRGGPNGPNGATQTRTPLATQSEVELTADELRLLEEEAAAGDRLAQLCLAARAGGSA